MLCAICHLTFITMAYTCSNCLGGIGLGVLRTALAAGYAIRCYTYVDRDKVNRRIARSVLDSLEQQYRL